MSCTNQAPNLFEGLKLSPPIELEAEEEEGEKKIWSKTVDSRPTPTCHEGSASLDRMTIDRKSSVGQILFTLTLNNKELDMGLFFLPRRYYWPTDFW